jgi:bifunctional non-homologous end joining protein LigD/DNA ligase-1
MLATPAAPFDSPDYVFEIKWDGVRALAAVETAGCRLWGRQGVDYTARYPELGVLRALPAGTLVDGELIVLQAGRPNLPAMLRRHQLCDPWRWHQAPRWCPVHYVLFDLLYHRGRCLLAEPLTRRRAVLADVCAALALPQVQFSTGVIGSGQAVYAAVLAQGHEGVMAKHQATAYRPGQRSPAWRKIKPPRTPRAQPHAQVR